MANFHTSADIFIVILLAYIGLMLILGARQLFFEPFPENGETEKETNPAQENYKTS